MKQLGSFKNLVSARYSILAGDVVKDLSDIKTLLKGVKMDHYAKAYYDKLETAAKQYGKDGLQSQVAYLLSNLEGTISPEIEKKLLHYANTGRF